MRHAATTEEWSECQPQLYPRCLGGAGVPSRQDRKAIPGRGDRHGVHNSGHQRSSAASAHVEGMFCEHDARLSSIVPPNIRRSVPWALGG